MEKSETSIESIKWYEQREKWEFKRIYYWCGESKEKEGKTYKKGIGYLQVKKALSLYL